jgi:IPTL-CTERM motif
MRRAFAVALLTVLAASTLHADVSLVERKALTKSAKTKNPPGHRTNATGSVSLIDNQGLQYFINTDITFSTSSSASAAMSEASYTHAVAASTASGGTTSSTLNDAFDGYQSMCLSLNHAITAPCETGNANFVIYNKNDAAPTSECLGSVSGVNRQLVFPVQTSGNIQMFRKVFVPDNDQFGRWLNYFTNTGGTAQTVTMMTSNNLGSDNNTVITATSTGSLTPSTSDLWVATFQNFTGHTTSDPRLGHVMQGTGAAVPLSGIFFQNGNDNPYWGYTFTLNPGETKIIMNFVAAQPSRAAAASKAAELAGLPDNALQCVTTAERSEIVNFAAQLPIAEVPTLSRTALAALVLLLGATAAFRLRRKAAV